jgi:hypothetical protein
MLNVRNDASVSDIVMGLPSKYRFRQLKASLANLGPSSSRLSWSLIMSGSEFRVVFPVETDI